jgi:hypothetical protein
MANLSDRLKQFEQTTKSEQEAIETMLRDGLNELSGKLSGLQDDARNNIESDTRTFIETVRENLSKTREAIAKEMLASLDEAQTWNRRGATVWAKSGWLLIVWVLALILASAWSAYLWREIPRLQARWNALTESYQKQSTELDILARHRVQMHEDADKKLWVRVDPKVHPRKDPDGTLWLMAEGKD